MSRAIRFRDSSTVLEDLSFPIDRRSAATHLADVTLLLADGEVNLGELIAETHNDEFESAADLETALHTVLPRGAIGEPYQSEGDA